MQIALTRRTALLGSMAACASMAVSSLHALGATWPARTIKVVVGGAAGSVPDTLMRITADALSARLSQPVIIENRPGAGGIAAMLAVIESAPDGYTLGLATILQAVFNSYLFSKLAYDPRRDLVPIAKLATSSSVLVANPALEANTLADVIALSQREPGRLLLGIPANGSPPHIAAILLLQKSGLKATFVPFRSGPDALTAAMRGDVQLLIDGPTLLAQQVAERKLKALVVTGPHRHETLPDVPTLVEVGFKDAASESWMGLVAPQGTPQEAVARLDRETRAIVHSEDFVRRLKTLSFVPQFAPADEFAALIGREHERWSGVLRTAGLKFD